MLWFLIKIHHNARNWKLYCVEHRQITAMQSTQACLLLNFFWQMSHVNQVPSLCDFSRCVLSWRCNVKQSEQCLHEYGFASVWIRTCCFSSLWILNRIPQEGHSCGLQWCLSWRFRLYDFVNRVLQAVHSNCCSPEWLVSDGLFWPSVDDACGTGISNRLSETRFSTSCEWRTGDVKDNFEPRLLSILSATHKYHTKQANFYAFVKSMGFSLYYSRRLKLLQMYFNLTE